MESTDDTPKLFVAAPDWAAGVLSGFTYRTEVARARKGLEQRAQRRRTPIDTMTYLADRQATSINGINESIAESRGVLHTPWWAHGIQIRVDMAAPTTVGIVHEPLIQNWNPENLVWIESASQPGELRIVTAIIDNNITLQNEGGHTNYLAEGGWVYPVVRAVREADENTIQRPTQFSRNETISLRKL